MIAPQDFFQMTKLHHVPLVRLDNTQRQERLHAQTVPQEHTPISKVLPLAWTVNQENSHKQEQVHALPAPQEVTLKTMVLSLALLVPPEHTQLLEPLTA
jgi:hypothetical protein